MEEFRNYEYEEEIDLKRLLIYVLRKWRIMIAAAVVLGLLLGGAKAVKGFIDLQDPEKVEESIKEAELERQNYDTAKAQLINQMAEYNRQIDDYQKYQDNSLYMRLDPYAVYKESITYVVTTDYQILPNMTYQSLNWMGPVLSAYTTVANSVTLKDLPSEGRAGLSEEWDADSLEKLVKVETNANDGKLTITASAESETRAKAILQAVKKKVEANQKSVAEAAGNHKLSLISEKSTVTVDQNIINDRDTKQKNVTALRDAADRAVEKYNKLSEPKDNAISVKNTVKNGIKFGIVGIMAGIFLICFWACAKYLLDDVLHDPVVLAGKYQNRVLGTISKSKGRGFIDRKIDALDGGGCDSSSEEIVLRTVAASLEQASSGKEKVLVAGTADAGIIEDISSHLAQYCDSVEVVFKGNLLKDAAAVEKLKEADSVLLVEMKDISRNKEIERELEVIRQLGKRTDGFLLI